MKGGKAIVLAFITAISCTAGIYGQRVYIAPIVSVDEGEESYGIDERFREDIYASIEEQKGALEITVVKTAEQIKTVRSSYDALKVCKEGKIEYLVYGWIKKGAYTYEGELRIFDGEGRKNIYTVYEKDGEAEYETFIRNISGKVVGKLRELFYLPAEEEEERHSKINVQTEIGYWTFMNKDWLKYLTGTISVGCGLEIIPNDRAFSRKESNTYFSIGVAADYRLAVSKKGAIKSTLHNVNITGYTNMYINFHNEHTIYGKCGVLYDIDILTYTDKYAERSVAHSGTVGIMSGVGYKYGVSEKVKLVFASDFECLFYKNKVAGKYKGIFGVDVEIFKKEHKRT